VKSPTDPPPGPIAVPVPKAVLLLTEAEYLRGLRRGKWWRRTQAEAKRERVATQRPPEEPISTQNPNVRLLARVPVAW
jgi:hypothetical protein